MNLRPLLSTLVLLAACEPEFDPYNQIAGLRVLLVRADRPELVPGESATLDALIYHDGAAPSRRWSLCPWPSDANGGFECALDQETWQRVWSDAGLSGDAPSLSLGSGETASIPYPSDHAGARALCEELTKELASAPSLPPDCTRSWPWTVRLSVAQGEASIETVKDVTLLLDDSLVPNQNPSLTQLEADGDPFPEASPLDLKLGTDHALLVGLGEDAAEMYLPPPALGQEQQPAVLETLLFTWFVDQGETEYMRTVYKDGVEPLDEAVRNTYRAPGESGDASIIVVVRDPRGGVDYLERQIRVVK